MATSKNKKFKNNAAFIHKGITYSVGDWVALQNGSERDWVAKIVKFIPCVGDYEAGTISCQWAWYPNELKAEVLKNLDINVYSSHEVVLSDNFVDTNSVRSINCKLQVVSYEEFVKLGKYPELRTNGYPKTFFYRQTLSPNGGLYPDLSLDVVVKISNSKLHYSSRNPDLIYYKCTHCKLIYHPEAAGSITKNKMKPNSPDFAFICIQCKALPKSIIRITENKDAKSQKKINHMKYGSKQFEPKQNIMEDFNQLATSDCVSQTSLESWETSSDFQKSKQSLKEIQILKEGNIVEDEYASARSSASEGRNHDLVHDVSADDAVTCHSPSSAKSLRKHSRKKSFSARTSKYPSASLISPESKPADVFTKQNALSTNIREIRKLKLMECLQRGISELYQKNKIDQLLKNITPEILAERIEEEFFNKYGHQDTRKQKQRFFDIYSNLKRDNNADLRQKVLTGKMPVKLLVVADVQTLAPDTLQQERKAEQQRYFTEHILLRGVSKPVMRLTHKGLEEIDSQKEETNISEASPKSLKKKFGFSSKQWRHRAKANSLLPEISSPINLNLNKLQSESPSKQDVFTSTENNSDNEYFLSDSSVSSVKSTTEGRIRCLDCKEKRRSTELDNATTAKRSCTAFHSHGTSMNIVDAVSKQFQKAEKQKTQEYKTTFAKIINHSNRVQELNNPKHKKRLIELVPGEYKGILPAPPNIELYTIESLVDRLRARLQSTNYIAAPFLNFLKKGKIRVDTLQNFFPSYSDRINVKH